MPVEQVSPTVPVMIDSNIDQYFNDFSEDEKGKGEEEGGISWKEKPQETQSNAELIEKPLILQ